MAERVFRSKCPVNLALEVLGDRWSLIVIRDIMFGNKRYFRALSRSDEGIAFNILTSRLRTLVDAGLLTRADDPHHRQKATYSLTGMAIDLVPVLLDLGLWAIKYFPTTEQLSARILLLAKGGPEMLAQYQRELRAAHLPFSKSSNTVERPITEALEAAYQSAVQKGLEDRRPATQSRRPKRVDTFRDRKGETQ